MAFEQLEFSKSWKDPADFPAYEPDETQVREDLQLLHDETKAAVNALIAALNDPSAAAQLPFSPVDTLQANTVQEAIEQVYRAVKTAAAAQIVEGSVQKKHLETAFLERIFGGRLWVSMEAPKQTDCPDTQFPVGQLWLRPGFTASALQGTWNVQGAEMTQEGNGWRFTTDGSQDYLTASVVWENAGSPGDRVLVRLFVGECSSSALSWSVSLDGIEQDVEDGAFEAVVDQDGALELRLYADWSDPVAGESIVISSLTAVNTAAAETVGCEPLEDWSDILDLLEERDTVTVPRSLWVQSAPGKWEELVPAVLPVSRGGTGLTEAAQGAVICGADGDKLKALPGAENGLLIWKNGAQWADRDGVLQGAGYLRMEEGTYTGTGGDETKTVTLPVVPKILLICPEDNSYSTQVLINGGNSTGTYEVKVSTYIHEYRAMAALQGNVLTFSNEAGSGNRLSRHLNEEGKTYRWLALY